MVVVVDGRERKRTRGRVGREGEGRGGSLKGKGAAGLLVGKNFFSWLGTPEGDWNLA